MELVKTIRGFHWVTKIVIALTILLVALFLAALIANSYGDLIKVIRACTCSARDSGM